VSAPGEQFREWLQAEHGHSWHAWDQSALTAVKGAWNAGHDSAAAAERERITALFNEWITLIMAEPNAHPPQSWITAFTILVEPVRKLPASR
jgi:hypothetical protein